MNTAPKRTRRASSSGFARGLGIALLFCVATGGIAYKYLSPGVSGGGRESPAAAAAALAGEAKEALEAVKARDLKTTYRPARYDAILAPIDKMLRAAKETLESPDYSPADDFEAVRAYAEPVMAIALAAHGQSQTETSFLRKDYRFMQQRGDAAQYYATAMWNRLEELHRREEEGGGEGRAFIPSPPDSERLLAILGAGVEADPENANLLHLRGMVERANGAFPAAERDFRKALELDADLAPAWNDLGLAHVNLKEFGEAEKDFASAAEKAKAVADRAGVPPGEVYVAAMFNLAQLHEGLASYYERSLRSGPSADGRAELRRHVDGAMSALEAIADATAPDSDDHREARRMLAEIARAR